MADATQKFFETLAQHGHEPLLEKASGVVRVDLTEDAHVDQWLITIKDGDVTVVKEGGEADSILHTSRATFNMIAKGELHALVALLRGVAVVEGDLELTVLLQRLLPGPPHVRAGQRRPEREGDSHA